MWVWNLVAGIEGGTRLRVFENRALRRIFGPKRNEVTREWRKLQNQELNDPYSAPNIFRVVKSRRMRWVGHVARMGEKRGVYNFLVGKPEWKRPLRRLRSRWENNINMDLQEVGWGHYSGYGQVAGSCGCGNEHSGSIKCGKFLD